MTDDQPAATGQPGSSAETSNWTGCSPPRNSPPTSLLLMLTRRKWAASCHDPHGSADNLGRNRSPSGVSQALVWRLRRRDDTRLSTLYGCR